MDINKLNRKYLFTETEKNILEYLNDNINILDELPIREVAESCFVSPATIIKLAKKMNLSGYNELISKMQEQIHADCPEHFYKELKINSIYDVIRHKEKAFNDLLEKYSDKNIMILANGFSQHIANYLYEILLLKKYRVLLRPHLEIIDSYQDVLLIAISESGETVNLKNLLIDLPNPNIDIISFTGNTTSTIARLSTLDLSVDFYKGLSSFDQNCPHFFYGMGLILFESLVKEI